VKRLPPNARRIDAPLGKSHRKIGNHTGAGGSVVDGFSHLTAKIENCAGAEVRNSTDGSANRGKAFHDAGHSRERVEQHQIDELGAEKVPEQAPDVSRCVALVGHVLDGGYENLNK
jgi:hypothetical protein